MRIPRLAIAVSVAAILPGCHETGSTVTGAGDGWRREFAVRKADLGPTGSSPYFRLEPGAVQVYSGWDTTLVVTVLDETMVVDGVTVRVVEERESSKGELVEVSRNYFAIDRASGDVYYFGEDVDMYKHGRVTGHEGGWRSGVNGAHFGLAFPARPVVGDRYYQELAPGAAMDRAEIVAVEEKVTTPAGVFEHCVHVRETTPLESDIGHKWYAPGVGLLKDDEVELASRSAK